MADAPGSDAADLQPHFGLLQARALNVTFVVGLGVFVTIPLIVKEMPGPSALLAWLAAGVLILADGLIWSELAAAMPGSGGSYLYLLEAYGPQRWGRLMAFLFVWQFLLSGPLEIASGLIAIAQVAKEINPVWARFDDEWSRRFLTLTIGPSRIAAVLIAVALVLMLYRRINILGRLTVIFGLCVMAAIAWVLIEGGLRFDPQVAFDTVDRPIGDPVKAARTLGKVMTLAIYAYLGYYSVCYIGDEVRDPVRTIPRSILISGLLICLLFVGLHLALLGTISWRELPTTDNALASYSLPAAFMRRIHDPWAVILVSLLLIASSIGSGFAGLLSYSRVPFGAARRGHFFAVFAKIHPTHRIPHYGLFLVGGLTMCLCFFDLQNVIDALIVTRILEQFIGQGIGLMLLRARKARSFPYRMPFYPLPCLAALAGWLFLYVCADLPFILLGFSTLGAGVIAFLVWSRWFNRFPEKAS